VTLRDRISASCSGSIMNMQLLFVDITTCPRNSDAYGNPIAIDLMKSLGVH
jgi:hypothetical protein